jgi:hypothetical protein
MEQCKEYCQQERDGFTVVLYFLWGVGMVFFVILSDRIKAVEQKHAILMRAHELRKKLARAEHDDTESASTHSEGEEDILE